MGGIRASLHRIAWATLDRLGAARIARRLNRNRILVVMYHGVVPDGRPYYNWSQLPESRFRKQLEFLKKHFHVLPLDRIVRAIANREPLPPNTAAITFDDGFENNASVAWPHLRELGLPATIFLVTDYVGTSRILWPDEVFLRIQRARQSTLDLTTFGLGQFSLATAELREASYERLIHAMKLLPHRRKDEILKHLRELLVEHPEVTDYTRDFAVMTWEQVHELRSSGLIEFGAHTVTHEILTRVSTSEAYRQITESCATIRRMLGTGQVMFAYPNGGPRDFDGFVKETLRSDRALCGLSTIEGLNSRQADPYALHRVSVGADGTMHRFHLKTSGFIPWLRSLRAFFLHSAPTDELGLRSWDPPPTSGLQPADGASEDSDVAFAESMDRESLV